MRAPSRGVKDLDPPLAVVHYHDPPRLGAQRQPGGVDQRPPAPEGLLAENGCLPPTWETQIGFLAPGLSLAWP
uniref:Uncharacterized protein n=1 Tax=Oryctolagus cuniculus TaxID=9986 RepID=A0A5F9CYA1_RABIT